MKALAVKLIAKSKILKYLPGGMKDQHSKQHQHLEVPAGPEVLGSPCALKAFCSREGTGTAGSLYGDEEGMLSLMTG